MLSELSFVQWHLAANGIFVRGALTTGHHFENQRMIFSEGLISAYEMEKNDLYPRILIANSIIQRINNEPTDHYKKSLKPHLIIGPDGKYFIDYLQGIFELDDNIGHFEFMLRDHKSAILNQLNTNFDNHYVVEKYRWLAEYHNKKFHDIIKAEDWVDEYFNELQEKLLIPLSKFPTFTKV